jgi:hypothetical protein
MSESNELPPWLPAEVADAVRARFPDNDLHAVKTEFGAVILKVPSALALDRWAASKLDSRRAAERFALDCAAYPDEATLQGYFAKRPLMGTWLAGKAREYAVGATEEADAKL